MENNLISNLKIRFTNLNLIDKKKLKVFKRPVVAIAGGVIIGVTAFFSGGDKPKDDFGSSNLSGVIDNNADDTYVDDAFEISKDFNDEIRKKSEYLSMIEKIDNLQLEEFDGMKINEEIYMSREELSNRVDELIKKYEADNLTMVEDSQIRSELLSIRSFLVNGVEKDGNAYVQRAMKAIIKILFLEAEGNKLGIPVDEYKKLSVMSYSMGYFTRDQKIEFVDSISGIKVVVGIEDELVNSIIKESLYATEMEEIRNVFKMCSALIERGIAVDYDKKGNIIVVNPEDVQSKTKVKTY